MGFDNGKMIGWGVGQFSAMDSMICLVNPPGWVDTPISIAGLMVLTTSNRLAPGFSVVSDGLWA